MGVLLFAIGFTEAQRLYAPSQMAPAQYQTGYAAIAVAPALDAQPMYVGATPYVSAGARPVAETSTSGTSFVSGVAFVAGLSATFATLAHHVQNKATKHHHHSRPRKSRPSDINRKAPEYPPLPDIPWYTKIEKATDEAPVTLAALATAGEEFWDEMRMNTVVSPTANPWAPLTAYEHILEEFWDEMRMNTVVSP